MFNFFVVYVAVFALPNNIGDWNSLENTLSVFSFHDCENQTLTTRIKENFEGATEAYLLVIYSVKPLMNRNVKFESSATRRKGKESWKWLNRQIKKWLRTVNSVIPIGLFSLVRHLQEWIKTCVFNSSSNGLFCRRPWRMTLSNFLRRVLLFPALCVVSEGCRSAESLKFENRSTSLVKGCYCHNESLSLCFEIQPGFLQLTDKNNNVLAQYSKLPLQRFHAQVLGDNFLWWVAISFLLPSH